MNYAATELQRVEDRLAIAINERDHFRNTANRLERQRDRLAEALRFCLEELNPEYSINELVMQETYDERRPRRAALLIKLRDARATLVELLKTP